MSEDDSLETGHRVGAALDWLHAGTDEDEATHAHYVWAVKSMMTNLAPEDLSTTTLVSLLAILIPEHGRLLASKFPGWGRSDSGKILHLVHSTHGAHLANEHE